MAPKKKKAGPRGRRRTAGRRKRSRAGLAVFVVLLALAVAVVTAVLLFRQPPIKPLNAQVLQTFGGEGTGPGKLESPRGIACDRQGDVYVADLGNSRIDKFSPEGKFLLSIGKKSDNTQAGETARPGHFKEPSGVAVDSQGDVYVADTWNGRIEKFDPKGKFLKDFGGANYDFYSPRDVAVDAQGDIYVADTGNSRVQIFSPQGQRLKILGSRGRGEGQFMEVYGMALDAGGDLFVADPGNGRIHKYSPLPKAELLKECNVAGWQRGAPFWPHLTVDSMGHVYATDNTNRQIWVFDNNLKYLGTFGGGLMGRDFFASPLGAAMAPGDQLVVSDMGKNMILKFAPVVFPAAK